MGYYFVEFCALYGYGDVLALLGRYFLLTLLRKITVGKTPLWRRQREFSNVKMNSTRELRDFLNGLDNLHEYLKFSYPRFTKAKQLGSEV